VTDPPPASARTDKSVGEETAERYVQAIDEVQGIGAKESVSATKEQAGLFTGPYRRLFTAQVVSSFGDWIGFVAVVALASSVGKSNAAVAVGVVLSGRLLPGFFFGALGTALLDRWDRKRVMVVCDIGRGLMVAVLPFVHTVLGLFAASVFLELLTLMWTPAKEASVPNLVPPEMLASANSASLVSAYGTILPALAVFPALTVVAASLGHVHDLRFFRLSQESLAIYLDVVTFFISAFVISRLALPKRTVAQREASASATLASTWKDAKEGWGYIGSTYRVRAVIIGFCTGLIGGGMTVPLGVTFSSEVLHKGPTEYGLLELALGLGVCAGVLAISVWQKRLNHDRTFVLSLAIGGAGLLFAASMANIGWVMLGIGVLGAGTGGVYVLGFTILGATTADEIRGRIFGVFYTLVRLCLLLAFTLAPFLSAVLNAASSHLHRHVGRHVLKGQVGTSSFHVALPGARLTLWLGGLIILVAALIARRDLQRAVAEGQAPAAMARDGSTLPWAAVGSRPAGSTGAGSIAGILPLVTGVNPSAVDGAAVAGPVTAGPAAQPTAAGPAVAVPAAEPPGADKNVDGPAVAPVAAETPVTQTDTRPAAEPAEHPPTADGSSPAA
jgi:MFS family permease